MAEAPAPGWYVDPQWPERLRYWDGQMWRDRVAPLPITSRRSRTLRRTAFTLLPWLAASAAFWLLSPDLSDCLVGAQAGITLTGLVIARMGVLLALTYGLMFALRQRGRSRHSSDAQQSALLLASLVAIVLGASALANLGFVLFDAPSRDLICKNATDNSG